jgi:hypothetical protein
MVNSIIQLDWFVDAAEEAAVDVEKDIKKHLGDKVSNIKLIDENYSEYEITYQGTPKELMNKLQEIGYYDEEDANYFIQFVKTSS